jgi:L-amino acid N-acyltransferase YncA
MIRAATPQDVPAIMAIWNHYIRDTTVTFLPVEKTAADIAPLIAGTDPFLVWEDDGQAIGFARYFPFRSGAGYARTVEHTILFAPGKGGGGRGRYLMEHLCALAGKADKHSMIAGVSAENAAGVAFHQKLGFIPVATLPEVGFKFGRWLDLVLMQRRL